MTQQVPRRPQPPVARPTSGAPAPRRRHLMDPTAPRTAPDPTDVARLQVVQRRIVSALAFTTILHLAVGFVIAADHVPQDRTDARVALCVIGAAFGVGAVASLLVINRLRWLSPWLLAGTLPGLVGLWWTVL